MTVKDFICSDMFVVIFQGDRYNIPYKLKSSYFRSKGRIFFVYFKKYGESFLFLIYCLTLQLLLSSISALQWLCNADKKYHSPAKRMLVFFRTLYAVMSRGSRAVFQLYPENSAQVEKYLLACLYISVRRRSKNPINHLCLFT